MIAILGVAERREPRVHVALVPLGDVGLELNGRDVHECDAGRMKVGGVTWE